MKTCSAGMPIFFRYSDRRQILGIDFVLAQFERNAEAFEETCAVGLHFVGLPGSNDATRPAFRANTQSAIGAAASR